MIPRNKTGIDIKSSKTNLKGYKRIKPGDYIIHLRSFQGGFAYSALEGIGSPAYTVFTFKNRENFSDTFWKEKFTSYNFIQLLKKVTYGVRDGKSINYSDFLHLKQTFPSKSEQDKIGNLLSKLDKTISLLQRKSKKLELLKKVINQYIFVNNKNFKSFKLKDISTYRRGSFPQPYTDKKWYGGKEAMPFVQVVDVDNNLRLHDKTKNTISQLAQPKSVFVPTGSIIVTLQGSIGRVALTQYDIYIDRTILFLNKYKKEIDKYYFAYALKEKFNYEKNRAPGGTIKTITKAALSSFSIVIPPLKTQIQYGNLLRNLDKQLDLTNRKIINLSYLKQFLLQNMFI